MKVINRILEYRNYKRFTNTALEKSIGIGNGYLSKTEKRNGDVGTDIVIKLIEVHNEINLEWLMTGIGSMLKIHETNYSEKLKACEEDKAMFSNLLKEKIEEVESLKKIHSTIHNKSKLKTQK